MTHWHKRVPHDMAAEYISKGWQVWKVEEMATVLIWPNEGAPE